MKVVILSVKDSLIGFGTTFTAVNEEVAIRGFRNSIIHSLESDVNDTVSPEDLVLYRLGEFDSNDGTISPCEPCPVARGHVILTEYLSRTNSTHDDIGGVIDDDKES